MHLLSVCLIDHASSINYDEVYMILMSPSLYGASFFHAFLNLGGTPLNFQCKIESIKSLADKCRSIGL